MYPSQVAKKMNLSSKIIYDYIDTLPDEYRTALKTSILKNNSVWNAIKMAREDAKKENKPITISQALISIILKLSQNQQLELISFYFWVSKSKKQALTIANKIANNQSYTPDIRHLAQSKAEIIKTENTNIEILADVRNSLEKYGKMPSYKYLSQEHRVKMSFLIDLLGREELDR